METQVTTADLTAEGQRVLGVWNRLCAEIDAKAWGAGLFYGDGSPALSRDPHATRVVNPYCYFPFLWQEAFPQVTRQQMRDLADGARFYLDYLKHVDDLLDGDIAFEPLAGFASFSYHYRALSAFFAVLPPDSPTWRYFKQYNDDNLYALLLERLRHTEILMPYPEAEMQAIATGKHAIAKWIVAVMVGLVGREDLLEWLAASLDCYYTGIQLLDDVRDWRVDYQRRNFSYLLTQCIVDHGLAAAVNSDAPPDVDAIGVALFQSGHILRALQRANDFFCRAVEHAAGIPCPAWIARVEADRAGGEATRRKLREAAELKKARHEIAPAAPAASADGYAAARNLTDAHAPAQGVEHAIRQAIAYLLREQQTDFVSAHHTEVYHVELAGFPTIAEVQRGNTFQRAIIADALLAARRHGAEIDPAILEHEISWLAAAKATDVGGGWRYFPDFPVIPPDADSLGAMLQAFVQAGYPHTAEVCEDAIAFLLTWTRSPTGWFETWLVNPHDTSPAGRWVKAAADAFWGKCEGKDPEVTANVLYGLHMYDASRFAEPVAQGAQFLEGQQATDGCWASYWYCGRHYGTYVCSRLISAVKPASPALARAGDFLLRTQNFDGGWGVDGDLRRVQRYTSAPGAAVGELSAYSDPLNTALALLALFWVCKAGQPVPPAVVARGVDYLLRRQLSDGAWEKVEIGFTVRGKRPYGSRPFSTAFGLKALVAWRAALPQDARLPPVAATAPDAPEDGPYTFHAPAASDDVLLGKLEGALGPRALEAARESLPEHPPRTEQDLARLVAAIAAGLDRCQQEAALPRQMDVYLLEGAPARSLCRGFAFRGRPALAAALDHPNAWDWAEERGEARRRLDAAVAREYARVLLAVEGFEPANLLEMLWEDGVSLAFGSAVCGTEALADLLEMSRRALCWCQHNAGYLWQGVKPALREAHPDLIDRLWPMRGRATDGFPQGVGRFLGHKLIMDYQARHGARSWRDLRRIAPEAFVG